MKEKSIMYYYKIYLMNVLNVSEHETLNGTLKQCISISRRHEREQ